VGFKATFKGLKTLLSVVNMFGNYVINDITKNI